MKFLIVAICCGLFGTIVAGKTEFIVERRFDNTFIIHDQIVVSTNMEILVSVIQDSWEYKQAFVVHPMNNMMLPMHNVSAYLPLLEIQTRRNALAD